MREVRIETPAVKRIRQKWRKEAGQEVGKESTVSLTDAEEAGRLAREQKKEELIPVVGATPTGRRGRRRIEGKWRGRDLPDSLPTKGRLDYSAGWPVPELREEEEPEFPADFDDDELDRLVIRALQRKDLREDDIKRIKDLAREIKARGPDVALDIERLRSIAAFEKGSRRRLYMEPRRKEGEKPVREEVRKWRPYLDSDLMREAVRIQAQADKEKIELGKIDLGPALEGKPEGKQAVEDAKALLGELTKEEEGK